MGRVAGSTPKRKAPTKRVTKAVVKSKTVKSVSKTVEKPALKQAALNFGRLVETTISPLHKDYEAALKASKHINMNHMIGCSYHIGAHVSAAGGIHNAVKNAVAMKARALAFFLSPRGSWGCKEATTEEINKFKTELRLSNIGIDQIVPHGIYLMNPSSPDDVILEKSRQQLLKEVKKCEALGIRLYNFHPGSTCGKISTEEGCQRCAESINLVHKATPKGQTILLLENMSRQGNTIGGFFEELRMVLNLVHDKSRVGVCLDTCHAFAAGYDIRTKSGFNQTMNHFDKVIGFEYLRALHLNDSKGVLGDHKDRHENIGRGQIGVNAFKLLLKDERFKDIPMVLETPDHESYDNQIQLLYGLAVSQTPPH